MAWTWRSVEKAVVRAHQLKPGAWEAMPLMIDGVLYAATYGNVGPVLFWLNLGSKAEVDELFAQWKAAQAKLVSEPDDKPWKLREFMASDLDGNLIRVFYDFRNEL